MSFGWWSGSSGKKFYVTIVRPGMKSTAKKN
jgi:hypothetical protein